MNIFDYHDHRSFEQFHTELQSVFEFLRYATDKKALADKLKKHKENYRTLSSQAKVLLTKIADIKEIPNVTKERFKKGDFDMCKAFKDMKEEGKIEGKIEGRAQEIVELGQEFGLSESKILERLEIKLNLSKESASEYLNMYAGQAV